MKPVELEIFLQDGLTPGLKNVGKTVERFSNDIKKQLRETNGVIKVQKGVIRELEKQYKELEKTIKKMPPGKERMQKQGQLTAIKSELEAERAELEKLTMQQRDLQLQAEESGNTMQAQLRQTRQEIATLTLAYRSLSDEEKKTAQGKELERYISELTKQAGELSDAIADTNKAASNAGSDTQTFDALAGGLQLAIDGFGLATAGAEALGLSEEDLVEVQTKLQTALVASNAITSLQTNLQKQSALMLGVTAIQSKATAAAETIRTWAVGRGTIATKAATIAQAAFNAVAKANPYVLLATAVITVAGALYAFAKGSGEAKKAEEERQAQMEKAKQQQEDYRKAVVDVAGPQIASYLKLKKAWEALGDSFDKRKRFIAETKDEWHKLGKEINNVNDMERMFRSGAKDMLDALIIRAELKAYDSRIQAVTDEMVENIEKNKTFTYYKVHAGALSGYAGGYQTNYQTLTSEEYAAADAVGGITKWRAKDASLSGSDLTAEGAQVVNEMRRKAGNQAALDRQESARQQAESAISGYVDEITKLDCQLDELMNKLPGTTVDPDDGYDPQRDSASPDSTAEGRLKAERKSAEELQKLRWENEQDEINQMANSAERRCRQIALDFEKEKAAIKRQQEELAAINLEVGVVNVNENGLTDEQQAEIDRANELAEAKRKAETEGLYRELSEQYQSYTDKRIEIERQYNDDITALEEARRRAEAAGDKEAAERYSRSIAEATRSKGKALMAHDFEVLQQSPEYIRAFEDLRNTSTDTLQALVEQLERAKATAAETLNPQNLREYTTTIREIMDELDSRDPFGTLTRRMEELGAAERELATAEQRLNAVKNGAKIVTGLREDGVDANGKPRMVVTYLTLEQALEAYTKAKDKHRKASNEYVEAEKAAEETVSQLTEAIKSVGEAIGGTAGEVINLIFDIESFISNTINGIKTVQKTGADAIGAVGKASVILSLISTAITLLKKISELGNNAFAQYEAYAEKIKDINALTDAANEYRLAVLEARQEENRWFADDGLDNLRTWKEYHDKVYKAYVDKASEAQAIYQNESGGGWLTGAFNWIMGNLSALSWWDEWRDIWGQGGYKEGTTAAINNLRIETRKKSSGFLGSGIGGHSQKTEDLTEWARKNGLGELFDDKGLINKELAQSIINNYGDKLVGQTKETLEALIDLREKYDEYIEQLHEYVSSMYEPLVDNFVDSLWDWLDNGKDALDSFKEYASDTFRDIVSDMLRTIVLENVVGSYSDDISALYEKYAEGGISEVELMQGIAKLTEGLIDRYETNIPTLEDILENVSGMFDAAGIDLSAGSDTSQSGKSGGFTAMSQDQGTKLEGLFTSVQGHVANIDLTVENVIDKMNSAESYLAKIADNTKSNAQSAVEIKEMVSKLIRDGIKTR